MTRTMYNHKASPALKAAKAQIHFTSKQATIQRYILEGMSYNEIRHEHTNYDKCYRGLKTNEIHVIQNWINNKIDDQRILAVTAMMKELNKAKAQAERIEAAEAELEALRELFRETCVSKEAYIEFIQDMMDCSREDVLDLA